VGRLLLIGLTIGVVIGAMLVMIVRWVYPW
jgi:hypothetical protein